MRVLWESHCGDASNENDIVKQCKPTRLQRSSELINNILKSEYLDICFVLRFHRPQAKAGGGYIAMYR
jgi:hypothetical protein